MREEQFVTVLSWTLGSHSQRPAGLSGGRGWEQKKGDGSGTRRWGQQERGDTTETRHACKVFFHPGLVSRKPGGNQD